MARGSWESYFWPGTQVLRNHLGERDPLRLAEAEHSRTAFRQSEIVYGVVAIERTFDAAHLRALHRHLFRDIYPWAGQYRTVEMSKGRTDFADVDRIEDYLASARGRIAETAWAELDRAGFARAAAAIYADLNHAHPFREGNGRAAKLFLSHVVEQARFALDFDLVTPEEWNTASALSGPDRGSFATVADSLVPVFEKIAVDGMM